MNNDDDLYDDLPEETTSDYIAKIENKLESIQKQYDESQTLIKELNAEKHSQQKRIKELEKKIENLERNISSLYKTAVTEIKRKDNQLNELRAENDDIAFRRRENHRKRSANYDRDRLRDHKSNRERHRRECSPVEEKYGHRARHNAESTVRCKKLAGVRGRYDERQRVEVRHDKSSSSERNEHRNGKFRSQERHAPEPKVIANTNQNKTHCDRIEKVCENDSIEQNYSDLHKKEFRNQRVENDPSDRKSSLAHKNEMHNKQCGRIEKLFSESKSTKRNSSNLVKNDLRNPQSNRIERPSPPLVNKIELPNQQLDRIEKTNFESDFNKLKNGFLPCEAALLSMKKQWKLVTPIKATPDLLKEKYSQIENNKINTVIPMINEQRMLSPCKNVAIVEIISKKTDELEPTKPIEPETVTACSVTVSEDIEHGVFSRKSRKRPRIQKIITAVEKVPTC